MVFIAITTAIVIFKELSWKSKLEIDLRCDEGVSGWLSVISLHPDCDGREIEESFDVETACKEGTIEYIRYSIWADVHFSFRHGSGEETILTSKYGPDIQVEDHHGFFSSDQNPECASFLGTNKIPFFGSG